MAETATGPIIRVMTCGSVDDGKSTLIGRLLHDTGSLPTDQLAALRETARDGQLDFASLVDGLEAEREQGITIDVAYRHMESATARFLIADTPGHEQYTANMATAASEAHVAIILVDARKGLLVQTRRHATIASLLGVRHIVLAVNKMDLVGFDQHVFEAIENAFAALAEGLDFERVDAVPVAALTGENITGPSAAMPWYDGVPLAEALGDAAPERVDGPFRLPVQMVHRLSGTVRGLAGTIASGRVAPGDTIVNARTGETAPVEEVRRLDGANGPAAAGDAVTLILARDIDVSRGDLLAPSDARPALADQFAADIVWMNRDPLIPGRRYLLKMSHRTVPASISELRYALDIETGEHLAAKTLPLNGIGRCNVSLGLPLAFDAYDDNRRTGAFVLIDPFTRATVGAGLARFALRRAENVHWQALSVDRAARARLLGQAPKLLWFTGLSGSGKSTIADIVERKLHAMGRLTYVLDGDNVRHGLNRDLGFTDADRVENIRRVIEVSRLMLDAGLVVIASFISPFRAERALARELVGEDFVEIFVDAPLTLAESRDPKGLYAKARAGKLANFTGIDSPYEAPEAAEIVLKTADHAAEALADRVVAHLLGPSSPKM